MEAGHIVNRFIAGTGRSDYWLAVGIGVVVILGVGIGAVRRILEILPNEDVPVQVYFEPVEQDVAIGGGQVVRSDVGEATVRVSDLPVASLVAALGAVIVPAVAIITVVVLLTWLCRNLSSGEFFSRTNTHLVIAMSLTIAGGWLLGSLATTMASNGALAAVSDDDAVYSVTMRFSLVYLFAAIVTAWIAAAFHAGERLRRDAEGLV